MICLCALASLLPECAFGYLYGLPLGCIVLVGVWIGFWAVADSAIYKASLTELCISRIRTTLLGLQSALGYSMIVALGSYFKRAVAIIGVMPLAKMPDTW